MDILEVLRDAKRPLDNLTDVPVEVRLEDLNYFTLHPILTYTYLSVMVVSTTCGVIGNFMVIAAILVHEQLRTKANVYILSLAIADGIVSYFVQGFAIVGVTLGYGFFLSKPLLCGFIASICLIACSCSLWNMAAIAVNRYVCICNQKWYIKLFNTWGKCIFIALLVWVICALLELPNYFDWGGHTFDPKTMMCTYDRTANYSYTLFFVLVTIGPPMMVVLVCYAKIFTQVQSSRRKVEKFSIEEAHASAKTTTWTKSEMQLAKTLFIIFVVFMICWSPYAVVVLIDIDNQWPKVVYVAVLQLAHINSSLNSIIYAASNKDFRNGYKHVIFCWRKFDREGNMIIKGGTYNRSPAAKATGRESDANKSTVTTKT